MDIIQAIASRKSIRGFTPHPVPKETLRALLSSAKSAPSGSNIQSWEFTVMGGDALEEIKRENAARFRAGVSPSQERPTTFNPRGSVYRARQRESGSLLYGALGIGRNDGKERMRT